MQHLLCVDGQQRHHAAQQHGKQVQRDGAQNDGPCADEGDARAKALQHRALCRAGRRGMGHHHAQQQRHAQHKAGTADGIGQLAPAQRVQQPAQQRPANAGHAHQHAVGGDGLGQLHTRHDLRQQALHGRARERAGAAIQHQHGINARHAAAAVARQPPEQCAAHAAHRPGQRQDALAVKAVDQVARRQQQGQHGQKLRQAHIGQRQRLPGQVVHLPGHHHGLHLGGDHGHHAGDQEGNKAGMAVDVGRFGGRGNSGARGDGLGGGHGWGQRVGRSPDAAIRPNGGRPDASGCRAGLQSSAGKASQRVRRWRGMRWRQRRCRCR